MTLSNPAAAVFQAWSAPDGSSLASMKREEAFSHSLSDFQARSVSFSGRSVAFPVLSGPFSGSSAALDEMSAAFSMASVTDVAEKEADGWQKVTDKIGKWSDMAEEENSELEEVADAFQRATGAIYIGIAERQKENFLSHIVAFQLKKVLVWVFEADTTAEPTLLNHAFLPF